MKPLEYQPYLNLPPLAGLCTHAEAIAPGMSVEDCVRRLKRLHYGFVRLHEILTARLTAEPIYELKMGFAHHAYLCAEHVSALRQRVSEMREPPLGLDGVPCEFVAAGFDELRNCPTAAELLAGVYLHAVPMLLAEIESYLADTHPLTDAPSKRILRFAKLELLELKTYGDAACKSLPMDAANDWPMVVLSPLFKGDDAPKRYSATPFELNVVPARDERFTDLWNQGVNAEAFLYHPTYPANAKALMMLYKRIREIDVPEMMATIICQTTGKPWGYYRDMSRQLWDEARHAMMGEVGFVALGVDWTKARITFNWSYRLNTECTPLERHAVLFFIEQGLMPKTGKRYEFEVSQESGIPIMATIQDFDWADEVLHAQIGRTWLVPELGGLQKTLAYGDECWSRILSNWTTVRDQGLTRHDNWWPTIYQDACTAADRRPDPAALAFDQTYEAKRADIHRGVVGE